MCVCVFHLMPSHHSQTKQRWPGSFQSTDSKRADCLSSWKETSLSAATELGAMCCLSAWALPKTLGSERGMEKIREREDGEQRGVGERERRGAASLPEKFLLTGCGECWTAEVFPKPQTPPPPLAYTSLPLSHSLIYTAPTVKTT